MNDIVLSTVSALVASQCCVIQLLLNVLGYGCAGFSVLTPYSLPFATISVITLMSSIFRRPNAKGNLLKILIVGALLVSPSAVSYWNRIPNSMGASPSTCYIRHEFSISGLKCEGCASKLKSQILNELGPQVHSLEVEIIFEEKRIKAKYQCQSQPPNFEKQLREVASALDFSYQLKILKITQD